MSSSVSTVKRTTLIPAGSITVRMPVCAGVSALLWPPLAGEPSVTLTPIIRARMGFAVWCSRVELIS